MDQSVSKYEAIDLLADLERWLEEREGRGISLDTVRHISEFYIRLWKGRRRCFRSSILWSCRCDALPGLTPLVLRLCMVAK